jgi:hypothetical protein
MPFFDEFERDTKRIHSIGSATRTDRDGLRSCERLLVNDNTATVKDRVGALRSVVAVWEEWCRARPTRRAWQG